MSYSDVTEFNAHGEQLGSFVSRYAANTRGRRSKVRREYQRLNPAICQKIDHIPLLFNHLCNIQWPNILLSYIVIFKFLVFI